MFAKMYEVGFMIIPLIANHKFLRVYILLYQIHGFVSFCALLENKRKVFIDTLR